MYSRKIISMISAISIMALSVPVTASEAPVLDSPSGISFQRYSDGTINAKWNEVSATDADKYDVIYEVVLYKDNGDAGLESVYVTTCIGADFGIPQEYTADGTVICLSIQAKEVNKDTWDEFTGNESELVYSASYECKEAAEIDAPTGLKVTVDGKSKKIHAEWEALESTASDCVFEYEYTLYHENESGTEQCVSGYTFETSFDEEYLSQYFEQDGYFYFTVKATELQVLGDSSYSFTGNVSKEATSEKAEYIKPVIGVPENITWSMKGSRLYASWDAVTPFYESDVVWYRTSLKKKNADGEFEQIWSMTVADGTELDVSSYLLNDLYWAGWRYEGGDAEFVLEVQPSEMTESNYVVFDGESALSDTYSYKENLLDSADGLKWNGLTAQWNAVQPTDSEKYEVRYNFELQKDDGTGFYEPVWSTTVNDTSVNVAEWLSGDEYTGGDAELRFRVQAYQTEKGAAAETGNEFYSGWTVPGDTYSYKASESGITWSYKDNMLTLSGSGTMDDYASASEQPWKQYADETNLVYISDGIENVSKYAFSSFKNLKFVRFPEKLQKIDEQAFEECEMFKTVFGYKKTIAKTYADENKLSFISLDSDNIGDVNGDDEITSTDALAVLTLISSDCSYNDIPSADLDSDGAISSYDALKILQKVVGLE